MNIKNILYTVRNNLCTGCGVCEGACPNKAISMKVENGRFVPQIDENLCMFERGCHRCYDVCPGVGCELSDLSNKLYNEASNEDVLVGKYEQCFVGHSTDEDLRYHASSGGMVTQMLIWLLKTGRIDGAVVTSFDNERPMMVRTYIATNHDELIQAKGSKYSPVSMDGVVKMIKEAKGARYVIVGLPCHIQGFRKMSIKDKVLRDKVIAYFGLYCSCGRTFNLTEYVLAERHIKRENLTYFAYRDEGCLGGMVAKFRSGHPDCNGNSEPSMYKEEIFKERFQNYYHPLRSFFIPKRCLFCVDHYSRLADISFGDIHIKPYSDDKIGINSVVARTSKMVSWLLAAQQDGAILLDHLDVNVLSASQVMARKKYCRMGAYMKTANIFCNKVPQYDITLQINSLPKYFIEYCQTRAQQFIGSHRILWPLIKILKSKAPEE